MLNKIFTKVSILFLFMLLFPCIALADADRHASKVIISNINAEADDNEKVLITIFLRDKSNNPEKDIAYIASDRGNIDNFWVKKDGRWKKVSTFSADNGDKVYYITKNVVKAEVDGKIELGVSSKVKGDMKIGVGLKGERELWQYLSGHLTEAEAEIIPVTYKKETQQIENPKYNAIKLNITDLDTYTDNQVIFNVLNKSNQVVSIADDIKKVDLQVEVISKPDGADVKVINSPDLEKELREKKESYFTINTNVSGEYELKVGLRLKYKNSFHTDTIFEQDLKINIKSKQFGAKNILLYLNQKKAVVDNKAEELALATFIEQGRTFVPVRFIAEALGAEVTWLPEAKTIVLSRPDRKVTMTLGNNAILLDTGQVILSDVAPFIRNGSTVLPFRVIAEAFGAQVSVGYNNVGEVERVIFQNNC